MNSVTEKIYEFGKFRLDAENCILLEGENRIVDLTPKALQILCVLVEAGGRVVPKEEIIKRVWSDSFVEEANLSHHVFRLRKALGENDGNKFIETVPKRGYRFVSKVKSLKSNVQSHSESPISNSEIEQAAFRSKRNFRVLSIILLSVFALAAVVWFRFGKTEQKSIVGQNSQPTPPMTIQRITNTGKMSAATISPDGKFIAYSQNYTEGAGTLYVRQIDTNTEAQLLEPDERIFGSKAFSPDSAYIYYIVYDKRDPDGALYRISVLGGQAVKMLDGVRLMFTLSPDGKRVTFFRDEPEQKQKSLIVAALDGSGEQKVLTRRYDEMEFNFCPAFSPDEDLIAFGAAENPAQNDDNAPSMNVFTVDLTSGEVKKISKEPLVDMGMMNWMPDASGIVMVGERPRTGNQIYFLSYPSGEWRRITKELSSYGNYGMGITKDGATMVADLWETTAHLWAIDASGATRNAEQLTSGRSDGSRGLAALSDGSVIYGTRTGDDFDLWAMSEKGGRREGKPLTSDAFYEVEVCAAPDNRLLVFSSNRAGNQHLFRMNADGSDIKQLTFGESFDSAPDFSPNENSVVYASTVNNQTMLWKISTDGGDAKQLTDFECVAPSVSPDGKMIACVIPIQSVVKTATLAVISADGGKPLKTFDVIPFSWNYNPARWTPDSTALVFAKNEKKIGNLWKQNLAGSASVQFTDFNSEIIFNHTFSRDGKKIILSRGGINVNAVMLKNFKQFEND